MYIALNDNFYRYGGSFVNLFSRTKISKRYWRLSRNLSRQFSSKQYQSSKTTIFSRIFVYPKYLFHFCSIYHHLDHHNFFKSVCGEAVRIHGKNKWGRVENRVPITGYI